LNRFLCKHPFACPQSGGLEVVCVSQVANAIVLIIRVVLDQRGRFLLVIRIAFGQRGRFILVIRFALDQSRRFVLIL
jgi:hypothetical protein